MALLREQDRKYKTPEDICAHLGDDYDAWQGAVNPPIYQTTLFCEVPHPSGFGYTRISNPTTEVAERKIAALEGADGALCFGAGMGAITASIMHFVRMNCHIIMVTTSYPDTKRFAMDYLKRKFGVETTLVPGNSVDEIAAAIRDNTTLIYLESPSTSVFKMQDLEAIAQLARPRGIGTVIDNSYATPLYQQPLKWGIDISLHTISKYLCGHSNVVGGVVCAREEILREMQNDERTLYASILSPMDSYLLTMGLRTLPERMQRHSENGRKVAAFLENHPKVDEVFYPGSATYKQKALFEKYMTGTTSLISFVPRGTPDGIRKMIKDVDVFLRGPSWGGYESLISSKSVGMSPEQCKAEDLIPNIVRIHIGLEHVDTIINALDEALNAL